MNSHFYSFQHLDIDSIELSPQQRQVFEHLEKSWQHTFITGRAGTGKSLLLQYFCAHTTKKIAVVAPTGVAALTVGGQTIHSFFQIPPEVVEPTQLYLKPRVQKILQGIDTLVIDEISMVRVDLLMGMEFLLRKARSNPLPFGGVQLVLFGDVYQLPPVVRRDVQHYFQDVYGGSYFFVAPIWKQTELSIFELTTIFRQSDTQFTKVLDGIRQGKISSDQLEILNSRVTGAIPEDGHILLAPRNSQVQVINKTKLNQLSTRSKTYSAGIKGKFESSVYPTDKKLELKPGAQIMMIKNDRNKRWVNGSLGVIQGVLYDKIIVEIDGQEHEVGPETWDKVRYHYNSAVKQVEPEIISSFKQLPVKLAWAVTIHKSQGQTFSHLIVDFGEGVFAHGQAYVALSRASSLENLYLSKPLQHSDIIVDQQVVDFMKNAEVV